MKKREARKERSAHMGPVDLQERGPFRSPRKAASCAADDGL
jgi:hypothetical protein